MSASPSESFAGFAGLLLLSSLLCMPVLGGQGIVAALVTLYFCAQLVGGGRSRRR